MRNALAIAVALIVAASPASADDQHFGVFIVDPQHPRLTVLAGPIEHNVPLDFRRMLRAFPNIEMIALHSEGGDVTAGLLLAQEIHERGIDTYIAPESFCYSACSYVFLAGAQREVAGELGVHQMANDQGDIYSVQVAISDLLDTLAEFDVPAEVLSAMLRTPHTEITTYDASEAVALGINRPSKSEAPPVTADEDLALGFQPGIDAPVDEESPTFVYPSTLPVPAEAHLWTESNQYAGEVWWSTSDEGENVAMVAEATIPKLALDAKVIWRKNTDESLPAIALMTVRFSNYAAVEVEELVGVLVKDDPSSGGAALVGASAKDGDRSFVFAFSNSDGAGYTNTYMLSDHLSIDLALVLKNGRNALLTLVKDDEARVRFRDVLDSWAD